MRKILVGLGLCLVSLMVMSSTGEAELCSLDEVPAATLLFPYFQVDMDECGSMTDNTLLRITNVQATPLVAHVTTWSDWSIPILSFDIYLAGQDIVYINVADVFCNGNLPITGPSVSNHGPHSDPAIDYPECINFIPYPPNVISGSMLDRIRAWHTGDCYPPVTGTVTSSDHGNVAVGYVTVDVVDECSILYPTESGYFGSGGIITNNNWLTGDYTIYDLVDGIAINLPAVHIEADTTGFAFQAGDHTFYGRYVFGDASDAREPLLTTFSTHYDTLGGSTTDLIVWRESSPDFAGLPCGSTPTWAPLLNSALFYDENSDYDPAGSIDTPYATNRVPVSGVAFDSGMVVLNLQHSNLQSVYNDDLAQSWVVSLGRKDPWFFYLGKNGTQLDSLCGGSSLGEPSAAGSSFPLKVVSKTNNAVEVEAMWGATAYNAYMDDIGDWYTPVDLADTACTLTTWTDLGDTVILDVTVPENHWVAVSASDSVSESDVGQDSSGASRFQSGNWPDCPLP